MSANINNNNISSSLGIAVTYLLLCGGKPPCVVMRQMDLGLVLTCGLTALCYAPGSGLS